MILDECRLTGLILLHMFFSQISYELLVMRLFNTDKSYLFSNYFLTFLCDWCRLSCEYLPPPSTHPCSSFLFVVHSTEYNIRRFMMKKPLLWLLIAFTMLMGGTAPSPLQRADFHATLPLSPNAASHTACLVQVSRLRKRLLLCQRSILYLKITRTRSTLRQ